MPSKIDFSELGSSGLNYNSGFGSSGCVSEEFLPELYGYKAIKAYKEMSLNDAVVGATLFVISMLIRQAKWYVSPANNDKKSIEMSEFVEKNMNGMSTTWNDFISEALTMIKFGYSYFEQVYKIDDDGNVVWKKIAPRSQDTNDGWEFDENGGIRGMYQLTPNDYKRVFLPIEKSLLFRVSVEKNNPEGRSVLRTAYRSWYFKKKIENIEGIGIERDLVGIPVYGVDPEIMSADASSSKKATYEEIKKIVRNLRRDEQAGVVKPNLYDENGKSLYTLELLKSESNHQIDTNQVINRYDSRIAMTLCADFMLIGHEGTGSLSLVSSKTDLFYNAIGSFLESIASVVNRIALPRLFDLNGFDKKYIPEIKYGDVEKVDLKTIGEYISKISGSGAELFPDKELNNWLREKAKMPAVSDVKQK